jgi:ABC-type transport system substrate-binding protein
MKMNLYICGIIFLAALLLVAGCTQSPAAAPSATPSAGQAAATTTAAAVAAEAASSTPGPVDTLQNAYAVDVSVASNGKATNPQIIMTFNGGNGMGVIPEIDFQVTRSDGVVENDKLTQPLSTGATLSLAATNSNTDRAEVWVITPSGDRVKIIDQYVPFRAY